MAINPEYCVYTVEETLVLNPDDVTRIWKVDGADLAEQFINQYSNINYNFEFRLKTFRFNTYFSEQDINTETLTVTWERTIKFPHDFFEETRNAGCYRNLCVITYIYLFQSLNYNITVQDNKVITSVIKT